MEMLPCRAIGRRVTFPYLLMLKLTMRSHGEIASARHSKVEIIDATARLTHEVPIP